MNVDENEKKILILGASGFVGHWIVEALGLNYNFLLTYNKNRKIIDYSTEFLWFNFKISNDIEKFLNKTNPDIIINLIKSGLPKKKSEKNSLFKNRLENFINFNKKLMKVVEKKNVFYIFLSTDFVFDGFSGPYLESSPTSPVTNIGKAYNDIESIYHPLIEKENAAIVRSSLLLGNTEPYFSNKNLFDLLISESKEIKKTNLFGKFYRTPSHVLNLAFLINRILEENNKSGIFHVPGEYLSYEELIVKLVGKAQLKEYSFQIPEKEFFPNNEIRLGLNSDETVKNLKFKTLSLEEGFKLSKERIY
ncbi:MAG: hypothetical protein HeimC3_24490 [Candidatus Heimdallarchaeota archaeon LC_3]|nr:MAG: hypothetical protein HeimC3_24490 [Candidatus Heimdallarchaeota archaeon LC_3]